MTYNELKEMGFSHEAILEQGIKPELKYTSEQCADTWKMVKCMADSKRKLTLEQDKLFKDMMSYHDFPRIKYATV